MANFVSSSGFSLPENVLKNLRRSAFLSGTATGPETTKASIEGALSVGADRASRQQAIASQTAMQERNLERLERQSSLDEAFRREQLETQEQQFAAGEKLRRDEFNRTLDFREGEAESTRTTALFSGIGNLFFAPIFSSSGGKSSVTSIGGIIKSIFS